MGFIIIQSVYMSWGTPCIWIDVTYYKELALKEIGLGGKTKQDKKQKPI